MRHVTDRIRVFLFGICIAVMGLYKPSKALQTAHDVLDRRG